MKRQKYIDYDYDESFNKSMEDLSESDIERKLANGFIKSIYATKTIKAGNQLEVEIYPEFSKKSDIIASGYKMKDLKAQRKLNHKNSQKRFIRLANANFTSKDYWMTLTYQKGKEPIDMETAWRNIGNYMRRINYRRKKRGLNAAKCMYVTEWSKKQAIRCHHHIIIEAGIGREELEDVWKLGKRNQVRRLDPDEDALIGLATYLSKDPCGAKRWRASTNLKKPTESKNHSLVRMKQIREMVANHNAIQGIITKKIKGYLYREAKVYFNDYNGRYYIYVRMRKRGDEGG